MSAFKDRTGAVTLPTVDADGNVPVALADDGGGDDLAALMKRLIWEMRELRRAYCLYTRTAFKEYRGDKSELRSDHV
jgi:hypothetical protein